MVYLSRDEALEIDIDTFIEKHGINGLSGFQCEIDYGTACIGHENILCANPSFVKDLMENGWDPTTLCMMEEDEEYPFFDSWNTRFELYTSIYMASTYPHINGLFMYYFSSHTDHRDISDDCQPIDVYYEDGGEDKINDLVNRFKNNKGFEFLNDPEDPKFSRGEWQKFNPAKLNASVKIQSWARMIMCIKKVQLMRCVPEALFDKKFGSTRRGILEVKESNWINI